MPRAYSVDLRERVVHAVASGLPPSEVARVFDVSLASVYRWLRRQRSRGSLVAGQSPGRPRAIPTTREDDLRAQVAAHPDATLAEHGALWRAATGVVVSPTTIGRALARLGLPLKKRASAPPSRTQPPAPRGRRSSTPGRRRSSSSTRRAPTSA